MDLSYRSVSYFRRNETKIDGEISKSTAWSFVGGYLNFTCIFLWLMFINWKTGLIALAGVFVSLLFMLQISKYSTKNAPVLAQANRDLTSATLEYVRGLPVVKSFGKTGASMEAMKKHVVTAKISI